ncbi:hypothetical protein [Sedimentibacter sp.]|uniref:hypothetical protein n=1 Tax=Sedimentibacter sp. TaxID=1960295 RepID=UPI002898B718|nr:hypothetical protein [Sedimentibacter sp.]
MINRDYLEKKLPIQLMLILFAAFSIFCLCLCFILSERFSTLSIHGIDSIAFAEYLNSIYNKTSIGDLLHNNGYGYGWIFWTALAIFCLPGKIMFDMGLTSVVYIVSTRIFCLIFSLLAVYVTYKLFHLYIKNQWLLCTATLLCPIFPTLMYYSQRPSTTPLLAFFGALCVYFMLRDEEITKKSFFLSCLSLAACLATKLTSVNFVPIFLLLMLSRFHFKFSKENIIQWFKSGIVSIYVWIFLMSPAIALYPFFPKISKLSIDEFVQFISLANGGNVGLLHNFENGIMGGFTYKLVFIFLILCFVANIICKFKKNDSHKMDYLMLVVGYVLSSILVCVIAGNGVWFTVSYGMTSSFIPLLGLAVFENIDKPSIKKAAIGSVCILLVVIQGNYFYKECHAVGSSLSPLEFKHEFELHKSDVLLASNLNNHVVSLLKNQEGNTDCSETIVLSDWSLPKFLSNIDTPQYVSYSIWSNIQDYDNVEVFVLDKDKTERYSCYGEGHYADETLVAQFAEDEKSRNELITNGTFKGEHYTLVDESEEYYMFLRN